MSPPRTSSHAPPPSPFFRPGTPRNKILITSEGEPRPVKVVVEEAKAGIVGTASNLINAIVGSGIVGIPFSIYCSGIAAGTVLVILCALLTLKSLRLLIGTAQEISAPSYETLCEAAFGPAGFYFIVVNMFIMAYGAMVSYLMIIKDTLPVAIMGVDPTNLPMKRSLLFVFSILIIVPLSSQRDMAQLAKTSRISVLCDFIMVLLVTWNAYPLIIENLSKQEQEQHDDNETIMIDNIPWIKWDTVFVGVGVLSFAFVCQHSAFIIAGSLESPNRTRWGRVTLLALSFCAGLALLCGLSGYMGYLDDTQGNILNNLPNSRSANCARALLGSTMLFVYPMESFVARHVLVVTLFEGRRAHEGEDSSILARRDRRLALTMGLYIISIIPAILFENLGNVLSVTGAIGGSCLSYIGPGMCYLGVYGQDFIMLVQEWFPTRIKNNRDDQKERIVEPKVKSLSVVDTAEQQRETRQEEATSNKSNWLRYIWESFFWYTLAMPLWCWIATLGKSGLEKHEHEQTIKSPHLSRIAASPNNKRYIPPTKHVFAPPLKIKNSHQLHVGERTAFSPTNTTSSLVASPFYGSSSHRKTVDNNSNKNDELQLLLGGEEGMKRVGSLPSVNSSSSFQKQEEGTRRKTITASSSNKTKHIPTFVDYLIAIFYMIFGVVAMCAGLVSIFA